MEYPEAMIRPVSETLHGREIIDNYRWLEDADSPETKAWVEAENTLTDETLRQRPAFKVFEQELTKHNDVPMFSLPTRRGNRYFWTERKKDENQSVIYVCDGVDGAPRQLVNPNEVASDGTATVSYWQSSPNGKYISYGLSFKGDEKSTMQVMEADNGVNLVDEIPGARYSSVAWLWDETGFFYTRHPLAGEVPAGEEHYHRRVFFHKLGDDYKLDKPVFGEGRPKEEMQGITLSFDNKYLFITATENWAHNDVYCYEIETGKLRPLIIGLDAKFGVVAIKDHILLRTNYGAENCRVLRAPIAQIPDQIDQWYELIPETSNLLSGIAVTASKILAHYLIDACAEVLVFDYQGKQTSRLPIPPNSETAGLNTSSRREDFYFGYTNFVTPKNTFHYDFESDSFKTHRNVDNPINPEDYTVAQEWFTSADGTKVPMFIVHRKTLKRDGSNPVILYSYGGFGNAQTPGFLRNRIAWLERGGIYAIACVRGGGEYGEQWHRDGILENKQHTFDDLAGAAEHLIAGKYTSPKHLGIFGGSNGGLTVGATMLQRPDLFRAVICAVPLLDMVRFPQFLMAGRWIHEYGDPKKLKDFSWIMKWSPYHNVKLGVEYPSVMFLTGEQDNRVDPLHARKMTALLQAHQQSNPVLIRVENAAGHGPGKPKTKNIESQAYALTYFAWQLGLTV